MSSTRENRLASKKRYRERHPDRVREQFKSWLVRNGDRKRQVDRAYYGRNRDRICAYQRSYNKENACKIRLRNKEYYLRNKEAIKTRARTYRDSNLELVNERSRKAYWRDPLAAREKRKCYRIRNRARVLVREADYRKKNHSKIRDTAKRYYQLNKARLSEKRRAYYEEHRDEMIQRNKGLGSHWSMIPKDHLRRLQKSWRERNREKVAARARSYYWRKRQIILATLKRKRSTDQVYREKLNMRHRLWYKENLEYARRKHREWLRRNRFDQNKFARRNARRYKPASLNGDCTESQFLSRTYLYGESCAYCGRLLEKRTTTVDHVIPFSTKSLEWPSNLVPCCKSCNSRKNARRQIPKLPLSGFGTWERKLFSEDDTR